MLFFPFFFADLLRLVFVGCVLPSVSLSSTTTATAARCVFVKVDGNLGQTLFKWTNERWYAVRCRIYTLGGESERARAQL